MLFSIWSMDTCIVGAKKIIDEHKTLVVHVPHSNILQHSSFHSRNNRPTISSRSHHVTTSQFTQQQTAILRNSLSLSFSVSQTKYLVWKFSPNEKSTCSKDSQIHTHTTLYTRFPGHNFVVSFTHILPVAMWAMWAMCRHVCLVEHRRRKKMASE